MKKMGILLGLALSLQVSVAPLHFVPGEVLIRTKEPLSNFQTASIHTATLDPILRKYYIKQMINLDTNTAENLKIQAESTPFKSELIYKFTLQSPTEDVLAVVKDLSRAPEILWAQPNYVYHTCLTPNDTEFFRQWGMQTIQAPEAWDLTTGDATVKIAIIDTGIDSTHSDLSTKIIEGKDTIDNLNNITDQAGHGTHVSGIAAAITNNSNGVSGVGFNCSLMPIKAGNSDGNFSSQSIKSGLNYATNHHASVINMSFISEDPNVEDNDIKLGVDTAFSAGIPMVAAAGNSSTNILINQLYPASYTKVLSVSAIKSDGTFDSRYSNFGKIDLAAPGTAIPSTYPGNQYAFETGTSMAAPHVTGLIGLIKSVSPNISLAALYKLITQNATDAGPAGFDAQYGHGIINARATLLALDKAAPVITARAQCPTQNINTPLLITANVTDDINWNNRPSVTLNYQFFQNSTSIGNLHALKMTKSRSLYRAIVPTPSPLITKVTYFFVAEDPVSHRTTFPLLGGNAALSFAISDTTGPVITTSYQSQDFYTPGSDLHFTITDNIGVSANTLRVTVQSTLGSTAYAYPTDSQLQLSQGTLTLSNSILPHSGNFTVQIRVQDINHNSSEMSLSLLQTQEFTLSGPQTNQSKVINGPNPFNPDKEWTYIGYQISQDAAVSISIYSLNLQLVKQFSLQDSAGYHEVSWNGKDDSGDTVPNGVYMMIIQAKSGGKTITKQNKIAVLR